jgi:hypothetical protein
MEQWAELKRINATLGCDFYEGMVAWDMDKPYPFQLRSGSEESTALVKHRWRY